MRFSRLFITFSLLLCFGRAFAQNKGEPGHFDFYLLDIATGSDFCHVPGVEGPCMAPHTFVLHGLWPQNNDGSYPVNCGAPSPLPHPESMLRYTPNLALIQHEWDKHGTCTTLTQSAYFAQAVRLYQAFRIPEAFAGREAVLTEEAEIILDAFRAANPQLPAESIVLGCNARKELTQVAACFTRDFQPTACRNVHLCKETGPLTLPLTPR